MAPAQGWHAKFVKRSIFFWLYCCLQVNLVFLCWRNDPKRMTGWKHTWQCYDLFSVDCITTPGRTDRQKVRNYFQILIRNFWCIKVLFSIKIFWNSCQMYAKLHSKCSLSYSLLEYGLLSLIFQDHGVTRGVSVRKSLLGKVVMRPGFSPPSHSPITTPLKPSSVTRNLIREALFIFWYFVRFEWFYVIVKNFID